MAFHRKRLINREFGVTVTESLTLIVEPNAEGHRLYYVALLVDECRRKNSRAVILTTGQAAESQEWRVHLAARAPETIVAPPREFTMTGIAGVSTHLGSTLTILPEADCYGHYLASVVRRGWTGSGSLSLLCMRADGQPGPPLARFRPAKSLAKKALILSAGLRPGVRTFALRSPLVSRRGPLRWVADPVTVDCSVRQIQLMREFLDSQGSRYWLGVFGRITARKNLPLILKAIIGEPGVGLLIAGVIEPGVAEVSEPLLEKFVAKGGKVVRLPGPIPEDEFDSGIGAVDCVVVAHSNEGTSGTLLKAAVSGRRLVLSGAESLRDDAMCLGNQATWSPLEVDAIRRAIQQARRMPSPRVSIELGPDEFCRALTWALESVD